MSINPDFRDLYSAFADFGVRYLIVGAYAVTHYTKPRFTKDLDIWTDPEPQNAARTWKALAVYGAPLDDLTPKDLSEPRKVYQMGVTTSRIDILTSVEGLEFGECWERRTPGRYADCEVHYLAREDLIRNKKAVGRPQDRLDVANLEGRPAERRKPRRRKS